MTRKLPSNGSVCLAVAVVSLVTCFVSVFSIGLWSVAAVSWFVSTLVWWTLFAFITLDEKRKKGQG